MIGGSNHQHVLIKNCKQDVIDELYTVMQEAITVYEISAYDLSECIRLAEEDVTYK